MSTDSVRQRVLDAALDLFSSKGYTAASMDEIAAAAGMKGPNLYKYFKGKDAIFRELHSRLDSKYDEGMFSHNEDASGISTGEELKAYSLNQVSFTLKNENVKKLRKMCTIEQYRNEYLSMQISKHQFDNIEKQYSAIFADLIRKGIVKEADPDLLSLQYFAPISMLIQLCDREPNREEEIMIRIEKMIDFFIEQYFI
jgi:AcrR family transcriptional regulator